jgi:chromosome segregation ATPase
MNYSIIDKHLKTTATLMQQAARAMNAGDVEAMQRFDTRHLNQENERFKEELKQKVEANTKYRNLNEEQTKLIRKLYAELKTAQESSTPAKKHFKAGHSCDTSGTVTGPTAVTTLSPSIETKLPVESQKDRQLSKLMSDELTKAREKVATLQAERDDVLNENMVLKQRMADLKQAHYSLSSAVTKGRDDLAVFQQDTSSNLFDTHALDAHLAKYATILDAEQGSSETAVVETELQACKDQVTNLSQSLSQAKEKGTNLESQLATAHQELHQLKTKEQSDSVTADARNNLTKLQADLQAKMDEVTKLNESLTTANKEIHQLQAKLKLSDSATADARNKLAKTQADLQTKTDEVSKLNESLANFAALQNQLESAKSDKAKLDDELTETRKQVASLQADLEGVVNANISLQTATAESHQRELTLQQQFNTESDSYKTLNQELELLLERSSNEIVSLIGKEQTTRNELAKLKAVLQAKTGKLAKLAESLETLKTDFNRERSRLERLEMLKNAEICKLRGPPLANTNSVSVSGLDSMLTWCTLTIAASLYATGFEFSSGHNFNHRVHWCKDLVRTKLQQLNATVCLESEHVAELQERFSYSEVTLWVQLITLINMDIHGTYSGSLHADAKALLSIVVRNADVANKTINISPEVKEALQQYWAFKKSLPL